jgi:hypothetical protein
VLVKLPAEAIEVPYRQEFENEVLYG